MTYTAAIITLSDSRAEKGGKDLSKEVIEEILTSFDFNVVSYTLLPDDAQKLKAALMDLCDKGINFVVTTGGTGMSLRDITPETTKEVIDREIPGVAEAMRRNGLKYTNRAILARGICGIREKTVILNLPGSPKACRENLEFIIEPLVHGIGTLNGTVSDCGRK